MAKIFQSLKFQCTLNHAFENGFLTNPKESTAYIPSSHTVFYDQYCVLFFCKTVNRDITSHSNIISQFTCKKDLICSFFFIYDEEVTIRKRKSVLGHFAATEACIRPCVRFRSSEMSICSSLVALMALSFSPPLMEIVCFCSTGFYQCRCNKLQGCP